MRTVKVILANKLYIPRKAFQSLSPSRRKEIVSLFQKTVFSPTLCDVYNSGRECNFVKEVLKESPTATTAVACRRCPQSKEKLSCIHTTKIKDKKYISLYRGDRKLIKYVISILASKNKVEIDDRQSDVKLAKKDKFKPKWKDLSGNKDKIKEQKRVALGWLKKKYGIAIAPPRFGKTILSALIASKLGRKVIVVAHQVELLEQFRKDWLFATTLKRESIQINPTVSQVETCSVCLFTYQQFFNKKRLNKLKNSFGLLLADEVHMTGANTYTKIINSFNAKYRCGVTATIKRRDQKEFSVMKTFGPPVITGGSEMLSCNFRQCHTGFSIPHYKTMNTRTWSFLWDRLSSDKDRNNYIANQVIKDLDKNHKIIIPVRYVKHVTELAKVIRKKLKQHKFRKVKVLEYSSQLVKGKKRREEVAEQIRNGKYDVVVAISSMISLGFNAPPMSCLYLNAGGYHFDYGKLYQQFSRVRTPFAGKNKPLLRILVDSGSISASSTTFIIKALNKLKFTELKPVGTRNKVKL